VTYNQAHYVAEAIESVLSQRYQHLEVIVVDDGSDDGTGEVARRFAPPVVYCHQANNGTSAARNKGVGMASGDYLAFLDADDVWTPGKLTRQLAAFATHPEMDMVLGYAQQFYSPELDEASRSRMFCPAEPMPGLLISAALVKHEAFDRVGPFDTDLKLAENVDWILRAIDLGLKIGLLQDVVLRRRLHQNNKGISLSYRRGEYAQALKAALDRRRRMSPGSEGQPDRKIALLDL
jgi:glycosyltransferase involved in cell wall biosynthesis